MGTHYKHLNQQLRDRLAALSAAGHSAREIASVLGVSHTTVSRELRRNQYGTGGRTPTHKHGTYDASAAQHKAYVRRKYARYQGKKIHENDRLEAFVVTNVKRHWNPDEMAGYMKRHQASLGFYASKTTIYEWFASIHGEIYRQHLYADRTNRPYRRRRQASAAHIPNRVGLAERPPEASNRQKPGHYEFDSMVGTKSGSNEALAVLQERSTRLLDACKVANLAPESYAAAIRGMAVRQAMVTTFTTDNGLENRAWQDLAAATGAAVYFTDPYSSWQKGGVENANKMLRRYFPKGTDFAAISQTEIDQAVRCINRKPRRCLGYQSALELARKKGVLPSPSGALRG
jgi:IS30 family transposase